MNPFRQAQIALFAAASGALFSPVAAVRGNPDSGYPKSPEVHPDGKITFRLKAPGAEKVEVKSQAVGGKKPMTQSEGGLWEFTAGPVEPGIYDYSFEVDGVYTLDPYNRRIKGWRVSANLVEVPADPPAVWQMTDVPHGTVHHHFYRSIPLKTDRECYIYTPPGYGDDPERRYPVLYLLHGSGDDASAWTAVGRAHLIADNLIAAGKAEPLVIVMPFGHGVRPGVDLESIQDRGEWSRENNAAVLADFFQNVVPLAEGEYRLKEGPDHTAIAGLSMGGGQSLGIGLNYPGRFGWVAGFSSATPGDEETASEDYVALDPKAPRRKIWIGCGKDDFLLERNNFFHGWLERKGVPHEYVLTEGGHSWPIWRDYLETWLTGLFR